MVRRYRYTGSFFKYVYRTLQYAGRGIQPFYAYSLDEPVAIDADKRKIENVVQDPETGEMGSTSLNDQCQIRSCLLVALAPTTPQEM